VGANREMSNGSVDGHVVPAVSGDGMNPDIPGKEHTSGDHQTQD
jgi:hypothetical protein